MSVEGRGVKASREPSSNGLPFSSRDGETLWLFRKRPRLLEGAEGESLVVDGCGGGVVREPSSKEPRSSPHAKKGSPSLNDNELIPEFQIGSPVALMFAYLGCDQLACVSKFFLKFWLLQNSIPESIPRNPTPDSPAAEGNETASGSSDQSSFANIGTADFRRATTRAVSLRAPLERQETKSQAEAATRFLLLTSTQRTLITTDSQRSLADGFGG